MEEPKRINKSSDGTKSVWEKIVWKTKNMMGRLIKKECGITKWRHKRKCNEYKYIISNENSVEWVWNEMVLRDLLTIKERKKKSGVN